MTVRAKRILRCTVASRVGLFEQQRRLVALANRAALYRQDRLEGLVASLRQTPFESLYKRVEYFEALLQARRGEGDRTQAFGELERLALTADSELRACSLLSLGFFSVQSQDYRSALEYYHEAGRFVPSDSPLLLFRLLKNKASTLAMIGDHRAALALLDSIAPFARRALAVEPMLYFDWLNSWSLEMAEAGNFDEAIAAAAVVGRSTAALIAPSLRESAREIIELRDMKLRRHFYRKPADVIYISGVRRDAEHLSNRLDLFRASVNPTLSPALVKAAADCATKLTDEDVPMVQRVIDSLAQSHRPETAKLLTMRKTK